MKLLTSLSDVCVQYFVLPCSLRVACSNHACFKFWSSCFEATRGRNNSSREIGYERNTKSVLNDLVTIPRKKFTELPKTTIRFHARSKPPALCGNKRNGIAQHHCPCPVIDYQKHPPILFRQKWVSYLECSYGSHGFQWSVCQRFPRRKYRAHRISRLDFQPFFSPWYLDHHGRARFPEILLRAAKLTLARPADSFLTEKIPQRSTVCVRHGTGRGNRGGHGNVPSAPDRSTYRVTKHAFVVKQDSSRRRVCVGHIGTNDYS